MDTRWDGSFEHPKLMLKLITIYNFTLKNLAYLDPISTHENSIKLL